VVPRQGYDTFGCIGPAITSDLAWSRLNVVTRVDGVERQNYPLRDMIFSPHELVSSLSHDMSLLPGDVIACGTSIGVGSVKNGSTVEIAIEVSACSRTASSRRTPHNTCVSHILLN